MKLQNGFLIPEDAEEAEELMFAFYEERECYLAEIVAGICEDDPVLRCTCGTMKGKVDIRNIPFL